ncbi:hypothetical protein F511_31542 [Dorcoceras hygrometricum]|uniref:Uncharacterized protein n=1 Tax=Dorcoceras hygrometricum TaxID=472368 RepID=A0A2Z7BTQ1_9LAMI|nr:hypothetical protein F511_31542 [Dorcoceras hygrometricum]
MALHWVNFDEDKPVSNRDRMMIRLLEAELKQTRDQYRHFLAQAGLSIVFLNTHSVEKLLMSAQLKWFGEGSGSNEVGRASGSMLYRGALD